LKAATWRIAVSATVLGLAAVPISLAAASSTPSLAQVVADVATSVKITKAPNVSTSIPPLLSMTSADSSLPGVAKACYPSTGASSSNLPASPATTCAYGSTLGSKTILLTGDSQAGMWLPTFDAMGKAHGWKIVFLALPGCTPWLNTANPPSTIIINTLTVGICNKYNQNVAAWADTNHPSLVVLDGHESRSSNQTTADKSLISKELLRYSTSKSKLLVLSPIPAYHSANVPYTASDCLSGAVVFTRCQLSPGTLVSQSLLTAEKADAALHKMSLVVVTPLMCTTTKCTVVVKDTSGAHLVFYDADHINRYFGQWVASAFYSFFEPVAKL